jgi:hypothetical protein
MTNKNTNHNLVKKLQDFFLSLNLNEFYLTEDVFVLKSDLQQFEENFLNFLGFDSKIEKDYNKLCDELESDDINEQHKLKIWKEMGNCVVLNKNKKTNYILFGHDSIFTQDNTTVIKLSEIERSIILLERMSQKEWL